MQHELVITGEMMPLKPTHLMAAQAEASTIGLRPGEWPSVIVIRDETQRNEYRRALPFYVGEDNEFGGYHYVDQHDGYCLKVFND